MGTLLIILCDFFLLRIMLRYGIFGLSGISYMQAYHHASSVIQALGESDINVNLLVQVDKLVRLLETPTFAYLRLQVMQMTSLYLLILFYCIPSCLLLE